MCHKSNIMNYIANILLIFELQKIFSKFLIIFLIFSTERLIHRLKWSNSIPL